MIGGTVVQVYGIATRDLDIAQIGHNIFIPSLYFLVGTVMGEYRMVTSSELEDKCNDDKKE